MGELSKYGLGPNVPASRFLLNRRDRALTVATEDIKAEVKLTGLKTDGAIALAAHIFEGLIELDQRRQTLSDGDPITNAMLAEIQVNAMRAVKKLQTGLFNEWDL